MNTNILIIILLLIIFLLHSTDKKMNKNKFYNDEIQHTKLSYSYLN